MSENESKQKEMIQAYDSLNQQLTDSIKEKKRKDGIIDQLTRNFPEIDPVDLEQYVDHNLAGQLKIDRINSSRQIFRGIFWVIIGIAIYLGTTAEFRYKKAMGLDMHENNMKNLDSPMKAIVLHNCMTNTN